VITGGWEPGNLAIARFLALLAEIQPARPPRPVDGADRSGRRAIEGIKPTVPGHTMSPETPPLPPEVGLHRLLRPFPDHPISTQPFELCRQTW
jgi:hypothetical protein